MNKRKIIQLDVFRGLAALSVCAVHFNYDTYFHKYFAQGLFVQLFFALSGFVICYNYHNNINNLKDFRDFIIKRFKRLYPLHLFFLIIFLFLEIIKYIFFIKYNLEFNNYPFEINNLKNFLLNFFLLQHFADQYNFNGPSWSISVEMMLYVTFAIIIFINNKYANYLSILYVIIFILFFNEIYGEDLSILGYYSGLYSFLIGYLFCILYRKKKIILNNIFFNIFYFLILFSFMLEIFIFKFIQEKYIYSICFGIIFYLSCFIDSKSLLFRILFNRFFIFLGKISYSIYLSHVLIFFLMNNTLRFIFNLPTKKNLDNVVFLDLSFAEAHLFTFLAYIATIVLSYFTYNFIEIRFYKK